MKEKRESLNTTLRKALERAEAKTLLFSQRAMVARRMADYCCENRLPTVYFVNLIAALDELGYIDRDAVRRDYRALTDPDQ